MPESTIFTPPILDRSLHPRLASLIIAQHQRHGSRYDPRNLLSAHTSILLAYERRTRVLVASSDPSDGFLHPGYIGVTTGYRPAFILLYNSRSISSPYILVPHHYVLKTYPNKR